jgi:hypothetical protein
VRVRAETRRDATRRDALCGWAGRGARRASGASWGRRQGARVAGSIRALLTRRRDPPGAHWPPPCPSLPPPIRRSSFRTLPAPPIILRPSVLASPPPSKTKTKQIKIQNPKFKLEIKSPLRARERSPAKAAQIAEKLREYVDGAPPKAAPVVEASAAEEAAEAAS